MLATFAILANSCCISPWPELKPRNNLVLEKPTILVAEDLTPSQFLSLDLKNLAGMILEKTGRTSHTPDSGPRLGDPGTERPAAGCDCPLCRATGGA